MPIEHVGFKYNDATAQATRVTTVDAGGVIVTPAAPAVRTTNVARYADAGPAGVSAHGTHNITAGKQSYSIAVSTAASANTPTLDGVAIKAGMTISFSARNSDTLEAAVLITVAGDDVLYTEVL